MPLPTTYSIRTLWRRSTSTVATAAGVALAVFVLASSLMLAAGIRGTLLRAGSSERALVLGINSYAEAYSRLDQAALARVAAAPGVRRTPDGQVLVAAESVVHFPFNRIGKRAQLDSVQVRGIGDSSFLVRPEVRVVRGRRPRTGTDEAMIGSALVGRYEGLVLGGQFEIKKNRPIKIVGVFAADASAYESELWADLDALRASLGWSGNFCSITAQLNSPAAFDAFALSLRKDKREGMKVEREKDYYRRISRNLSEAIGGLGGLVAFIFATGAMLGAMLTMHGSVVQRTREIAVLRALGFTPSEVLMTVLLEAFVVALAGGALGSALSLATTGLDFTTVNTATNQAITFRFLPSAMVLLGSLLFGTLAGLIGGVLPALKASRVQPIHAMRAV